ncbi:hypothetical protein OS493_033130 [Desmophyllum pertusum]|uniref:Uncharacterized protein n=1 Tax=Desmophyllum pertusum TaxID=174260 RepID=A0A9W9YJA3_9CNID|nr:hypothetical protein OS493_033130 [Desmophyllum pertusum]
MKAVENELNKSIKRHLESAPVTSDLDMKPSLLSDGDSGSYRSADRFVQAVHVSFKEELLRCRRRMASL